MQIGTGQFGRLERDRLLHHRRILVGEEVVTYPGQRRLASTRWPVGMHMQEVRAQLEIATWPVGNAGTKELHREVLGFHQEAITAPGPSRQHAGAEPLGAMHLPRLGRDLRGLLLLFKLLSHVRRDGHVEGEVHGIRARQHYANRLRRLRVFVVYH